jgi:4-hydroxy-2-oxoheptanedioate aldolase
MTTAYWRTQKNTFKQAVRVKPQVAMWVTVPWAPLVEMVGHVGADAALIDLEHTTLSLETMESLVIAAGAAGITPIVRPPAIDAHLVSRVLDAGALGIVFANIRDGAQAEAAIRATLYPPAGDRGWGGSHTRYVMWQGGSAATELREPDPARRGVYSPEYVDKATSDITRIFIVESREGLANLDDILSVDHLDAVMFGWADYAADVGFEVDACQRGADVVYRACRERGIGVSLSAGQAGETEWYPGCFSVAGIDALLIRDALARAVGRTREAAHQPDKEQ